MALSLIVECGPKDYVKSVFYHRLIMECDPESWNFGWHEDELYEGLNYFQWMLAKEK